VHGCVQTDEGVWEIFSWFLLGFCMFVATSRIQRNISTHLVSNVSKMCLVYDIELVR